MNKAPSVKDWETRSKLDGVRRFNNKLPIRSNNNIDNFYFVNNNKKNNNASFSYNNIPDVPTFHPANMTAKYENLILKKI